MTGSGNRGEPLPETVMREGGGGGRGEGEVRVVGLFLKWRGVTQEAENRHSVWKCYLWAFKY